MKLKQYFFESKDELLNKVSWPTLEQLQNSTIVVLIATFLIAGVIYIIDTVFSGSMDFLYGVLREST